MLHQIGLTIDLCYFLPAFYIVIVSSVTYLEPGVMTSYTTSIICVFIYGVTCPDPGVLILYMKSVICLLLLLCEVLTLVL